MNHTASLTPLYPEELNVLLGWNRIMPWSQLVGFDSDPLRQDQAKKQWGISCATLHPNTLIDSDWLFLLPSYASIDAPFHQLHPNLRIVSLGTWTLSELQERFPYHRCYRAFCTETCALGSGVVVLTGPQGEDRAFLEEACLALGETVWCDEEPLFEETCRKIHEITEAYTHSLECLSQTTPQKPLWFKQLIYGLSKQHLWS